MKEKKKSAPETESVQEEHHPSVVSSAVILVSHSHQYSTERKKTNLFDLIKNQAVDVKDFGTTPDTKSTILSC